MERLLLLRILHPTSINGMPRFGTMGAKRTIVDFTSLFEIPNHLRNLKSGVMGGPLIRRVRSTLGD
jgi:hypothetical protein